MYILLYLITLSISVTLTNKKNEVDTSEDFMLWEKHDIIIMGAAFAVGVILEIFNKHLHPVFIIVYAVCCTLAFTYVNKRREKEVQEYKQQIQQIFEVLGNLVTINGEIDYNNLPFKFEQEDKKITKIEVQMTEPKKFTDSVCTNATYSLKRFFPYFDWKYVLDFPGQKAIFEGQKLPPSIAKWNGSDLRGSAFIPLGVSGDGEVGMNLGEKNLGESNYIYEDGTKAGTIKMPASPQWIVVGSTGGGKAIWVEQEIW